MTNIDLDKQLYDRVKKAIDKHRIRYANIRQFVNLAVKEKLNGMADTE